MLMREKSLSNSSNLGGLCVTETVKRRTPVLSDIRKAREALRISENINYSEAESYIILGELDIMESNILEEMGNEEDSSRYLESAKQYFYRALAVDNSKITAYYGLFEVGIMEENYQEASFMLSNYEKKGNNHFCNFELMYLLLNQLMGKENDEVARGDSRYIQDMKIDYEPLLANYHLAEGAFSNGDYQKVFKHLRICETLSFIKNLNIDFFSVQFLARKVLKNQIESTKSDLKKNFLETNSKGERIAIALELLSIDTTDIDSYFALLDSYLAIKAYAPFVSYLKTAKTLPTASERKESISLYERVITEEMTHDKDTANIDYLLRKGNLLEKKGLYKEAFDNYYSGYENYHYLYFIVKLANICYSMENYGEAIKYATEYLEKGYVHSVEATIILYKAYKKEGSQSIANIIARDCYTRTRMAERGKSLKDWFRDLQKECQGEVETADFSTNPLAAKEYVNKRKH